jgi:hypothetical protein
LGQSIRRTRREREREKRPNRARVPFSLQEEEEEEEEEEEDAKEREIGRLGFNQNKIYGKKKKCTVRRRTKDDAKKSSRWSL